MNELSVCIFRTFYQRCHLEEEAAKAVVREFFFCEVPKKNVVRRLQRTKVHTTKLTVNISKD